MKTGYKNMKCGLIGEHLEHSFSPQIHEKLADYSYELFEMSKDEIQSFALNGGLDAFNVTIPYKKDIIPFLDEISPEASAIGAVNTVVRRDGRLYGYNTDYFGFEYMLSLSGIDPKGKKALVLGRGGASLTVAAVLRDKGVSALTVLGSRDNTPENISLCRDVEIIVNATPVGMYPNNLKTPVNLSNFPNCVLVLDLIYNPTKTALLIDAEKLGITAVNGLPMLVAQAAKAFEFFTDDSFDPRDIERISADISRETRNIVLVGMPSCGKSTLGKLLAEKTGRAFIDADEEFTRTHKISPAKAITELGEDAFREMEHQVILELGKKSGVVIATGGGVVTREKNYAPLHQNGVILFLERKLENLSSNGRPLSQKTDISLLYAKRIDGYRAFADITLSSQEVPELTASLALSLLKEYDYSCIFKNNKGI